MPYITKERRDFLKLNALYFPETPGDLNYVITSALFEYVEGGEGKNYQRINDCLGALEGAKLEFYRRIVAPYEEAKKLENGDVYEQTGEKV